MSLPRALAVWAHSSQSVSTCCVLLAMISTWSPLLSLCQRGTSFWFTLAPIQCVPNVVWMLNAKSSTLLPCGMVRSSPLGVNTMISRAKRLSLKVSKRSSVLGCGSSRISLMELIQRSSSLLSNALVASLYFQCAASPRSAMSSMRSERICTSTHRPCSSARFMKVWCMAW